MKYNILVVILGLFLAQSAYAESMESRIKSLKIAPNDQALEITFDNAALRCPTVVMLSTAKMFKERLSIALAAMMADKVIYVSVGSTDCTVSDSNAGFIVYK